MTLAIDFGKKRTGTAILKDGVNIAFPYKLIEEENPRKIKRALMDMIEQEKIDDVVFGLPLSSEGIESEWCFEIRRFADWLKKSVNVNIYFVNEFGSSKEAEEILKGKSIKTKKKATDLVASVLILETYMKMKEIENRK